MYTMPKNLLSICVNFTLATQRQYHIIQLRRFTEIFCPDVGLGSLREFHPRCRNFLQYTKYCCETAPNQYAKFTRKSLLLYYAVLPLYLCYLSYSQHKIALSYRNEVLTMLFPALFALGGAFFFFVLRVQGADGSFPKPLTPDEEAVLLRRMQQDGDAEAREKLIEHNLRLVAHIVKKYYAVSTEQDDLLSIGTIGLIKAVNTFKADKNIRLATYASKCIQNELLMYFRQKRKSAGELSLSDTLESDGDGNALALQDIICCEDSGLSAVEEQDRYHAMHRALAGCLSPREREIIRLRYGIGLASPLPQREIAARLGISRSYVSRIEKRALEKLREALEREGRPP